MGKVQDTISSSNQNRNQRRRSRSSPGIALIIPSQQAPASHSFPTNYEGVCDWWAKSSGGLETKVTSLIKALHHSNRLTNSPGERLKIMDFFAVELQRVLPQLNTRFIGMDQPYSTSAHSAFRQVSTLLTELSFGYKAALVDVLLRKGDLPQKARVHTIWSAMHAMGHCGLRHSQSYQPWPEKWWRDINTLLLLAEHENALDYPVGLNADHKQTSGTTVQALYSALAVFSASRCEQLRPAEMDGLFSAVSNSTLHGHLLSEKPHDKTATLYSVALNAALPPAPHRFNQFQPHHHVRYFLIPSVTSGTATNTPGPVDSLDKTDFKQLERIWSGTLPRQQARSICHSTIATQRHVKNIVVSLESLARESTSTSFPDSWTMTNESEGGIGLLGNDAIGANVGDLMAWQADSPNRQDVTCKVGIVRWLKFSNKEQPRIGLEKIAISVHSATVAKTTLSSDSDDSVDALLGKHRLNTKETLLFLPPGTFTAGESISVSIGNINRKSLMKLNAKLDLNGNFDCFAITEAAALSDNKETYGTTLH